MNAYEHTYRYCEQGGRQWHAHAANYCAERERLRAMASVLCQAVLIWWDWVRVVERRFR